MSIYSKSFFSPFPYNWIQKQFQKHNSNSDIRRLTNMSESNINNDNAWHTIAEDILYPPPPHPPPPSESSSYSPYLSHDPTPPSLGYSNSNDLTDFSQPNTSQNYDVTSFSTNNSILATSNYSIPIKEEDIFNEITKQQQYLQQEQNQLTNEQQLSSQMFIKQEEPLEESLINLYQSASIPPQPEELKLLKSPVHILSNQFYWSEPSSSTYDDIRPSSPISPSVTIPDTPAIRSQIPSPASSCILPTLKSPPQRSVRLSRSLNSIRTIPLTKPNTTVTSPTKVTKKVRRCTSKNRLTTSPLSQLDSREPDDGGFVNFNAKDASIIMSAVAKSGNAKYKEKKW